MRNAAFAWALLASSVASAMTYSADPRTYKTVAAMLQPGDTLELEEGTYAHWTLSGLNGTPSQWITITGPTSGLPAKFEADPGPCCNTIEIIDSSYLRIRHLVIDSNGVQGAHGVSAKQGVVHHIALENNVITFTNADQQDVGISTKVVTWGWEIRGNRIEGAGTGAYLGNSDGTYPFIEGVIEYNLFVDTVGYNMQVKHQNDWPTGTGAPTGVTRTIIRHNVFIKNDAPSPDGDRPNVLVGGWPDNGPGKDNWYEIYGNFFFHNPREALLQATGRVSIHDNVFVDSDLPAIVITNHAGKTMKAAYVYNNTIATAGTGISVSSASPESDMVVANLVLSGGTAISGTIADQRDNLTAPYAMAAQYVAMPTFALPGMSYYPLMGKVTGSVFDLSKAAADVGRDLDFNGVTKSSMTFRGAYAGEGTNPGWPLDRGFKPSVLNSEPDAGVGGSGGGGSGGGSGGTGGAGGGGGGGATNDGGFAGGTGGGAGGGVGTDQPAACGCAGTAAGPALVMVLAVMSVRCRRRMRTG